MRMLEVRRSGAGGGGGGQFHRGDDLVRCERGEKQVTEKLVGGHPPLPGRGLQFQPRAGRHQRRRRIGGGIGVCEIAAQGAPVAHRRIAYLAARLRQQPCSAAYRIRTRYLVMRCERSDGERAALLRDALQLRQPSDIDQGGRLRQAQLQRRQEAVSAGQEAAIRVFGKRRQRFGDAGDPHVGKRRRIHQRSARAAAAAWTASTMLA